MMQIQSFGDTLETKVILLETKVYDKDSKFIRRVLHLNLVEKFLFF